MLSNEKRIALLVRLGEYISADNYEWNDIIERAVNTNAWFTLGNIKLAAANICKAFLQKDKLEKWLADYPATTHPKSVGIVMAGNIPLVGFHDFLCGFVSGHHILLKLSSKDDVLIKHLIEKLIEWEPQVTLQIAIAERLNGCDAYIATGSNNTARYFEQYFGKYPHIIRKNRTSVAILDGTETEEDLSLLADDIFSYFGLGCRNVTQVCIPQGYDITKLMDACNKYIDLVNHNKYKNNFDYYLAIYLLNKVHHYTNNSVLMVENNIPFSAVSVLHYRYYTDKATLTEELKNSEDIQCIVGKDNTPFGTSQIPSLYDYADGVDTMLFLTELK